MDVFKLRQQLVEQYAKYSGSFIHIGDARINELVHKELDAGLLWPEPLVQLNPFFEPGRDIDELVRGGLLHEKCQDIFCVRDGATHERKGPFTLHLHQDRAIQAARQGHPYVLTTGTGSGKSLTYIIPAIDHVLRTGSGRGIQAIIVYPMNALANSQKGELDKFLAHSGAPVTYARYTGQESDEEKAAIRENPPDIILTNYVMLELMLTRHSEQKLVDACSRLRFLVLDELHTYRGRQGAYVAMLLRRVRERTTGDDLLCVGTSATMASTGTRAQQRQAVAEVATTLFGQLVSPEHVIQESLRPVTDGFDALDPRQVDALRAVVTRDAASIPDDPATFRSDPLACWIETTFGLREDEDLGQPVLVRQTPRRIEADRRTEDNASRLPPAAKLLAELTGVTPLAAAKAIRDTLNHGCQLKADGRSPFFAFRIHQFLGRGEGVYCSIEAEADRHILLRSQAFVPGTSPRKLLYPMVFCRECGHPYYVVNHGPDDQDREMILPREMWEREDRESPIRSGYLYVSDEAPWPTDDHEVLDKLPEEWLEDGPRGRRVKSSQRANVPVRLNVEPTGVVGGGVAAAFCPTLFRFCLKCGVAHSARSSDTSKLIGLGIGGRSTATTILSMSTILGLRGTDEDAGWSRNAQKLLSFTDNRQDASLQAGHFNDFVMVGLIRSGLAKALAVAGDEGLRSSELAAKVQQALDLDLALYAADPEVQFQGLEDTQAAFRKVLRYRIFRDLLRGWRLTSPNLEQCDLVRFDYPSIGAVAADDGSRVWNTIVDPDTNASGCHAALLAATPEVREHLLRVLCDHLRRELAIKEDVLSRETQETIAEHAQSRLDEAWHLEDEQQRRVTFGRIAYSRPVDDRRRDTTLSVSPQSGFGNLVRRKLVNPDGSAMRLDESEQIIRNLFEALRIAGICDRVAPRPGTKDIHGYRLNADAIRWMPGDGTRTFVDPLRTTRTGEIERPPNSFFVSLYQTFFDRGRGLSAKEHTAQVPPAERQVREDRFRDAKLPVMFCSPTMELGIDIAELNVVNMRNVPPTPANYAQRSGRAGRSGQAALVFTYCSAFSPHDRNYFDRQETMVAGAVAAPRIELGNQDLVRSHMHAIWLGEAGHDLGKTLTDILDLHGNTPYPLKSDVQAWVDGTHIRARATRRCTRVLSSMREHLKTAAWYTDDWLDATINAVGKSFDTACDRWRRLHLSARTQSDLQQRIITDSLTGALERKRATGLRREAESQLELLTDPGHVMSGDFWPYRYFASEGFLHGYNFPRLPVSAYVGGRRRGRGNDDFLSRPRFLAIAEFGPQAVIYHEGQRYMINRVGLDFSGGNEGLTLSTVKICEQCGCVHRISDGNDPDNCTAPACGAPLPIALPNLFRMTSAAARKADRITSDEEERQRSGYEIQSGFAFNGSANELDVRRADVKDGDSLLATVLYGDATTVYRVNLGWLRRKQQQQYGFSLDLERGNWVKEQPGADSDDGSDADTPNATRAQRVVPYVTDTRNTAVIAFPGADELDHGQMAGLQAALKRAILEVYQLEPFELDVQPLPTRADRRRLMLFESAEGGAGVLRDLVDNPEAMAQLAKKALEICHFGPDGADLGQKANDGDGCEAGCYECLLDYYNQPDHRIIDRHEIVDILMRLARSTARLSPDQLPRPRKLDRLRDNCESTLELEWINWIDRLGLRIPVRSQEWAEDAYTRPDFEFGGPHGKAYIFIDGPHHDEPEQARKDAFLRTKLYESGNTVIVFHHSGTPNATGDGSWLDVVTQHPSVFGVPVAVDSIEAADA